MAFFVCFLAGSGEEDKLEDDALVVGFFVVAFYNHCKY